MKHVMLAIFFLGSFEAHAQNKTKNQPAPTGIPVFTQFSYQGNDSIYHNNTKY